MRRIELTYGGILYSISNRDLDDVRAEIEEGIAHAPAWLRVNYGEGTLAVTDLLLTPGVPLALASVGPEPAAEPGKPITRQPTHT